MKGIWDSVVKQTKRDLFLNILLGIVGIILFISFTVLFYRQAVKYDNIYSSDLPAHIKFAVEGRGYSLLYFFIGLIYKITGGVFFIAVFESLMIVFTWLISGGLICRLFKGVPFSIGCFIGVPIIFLTGIYLPGIYEYFYSNQLVGQPWHNITYFGMRLFAVLSMLIFTKVIDTYTRKNEGKNWILLTIFLALSTAVKPSFLLGFSFTLLLFLCADAIKARFEKRVFLNIIIMGLTVIPSLLILLFQSRVLYGTGVEDGGTGIILVFGANFLQNGIKDTILKLICSLALPFLVLVKNRNNLKKIDKFVYVMYFVQLAVVFLFSESGKRRFDGNFYWGLYLSGYILYLFVHAKFWENFRVHTNRDQVYKVAGIVLILLQFISGLTYFLIVLNGRNFLV